MRKLFTIITSVINFILLGGSALAQGEAFSFKEYKEMKIAFGSFDLFNGLTFVEIETLASRNLTFFFGFLILCLWVSTFLRKPKRSN
ncbi:MAG: hypothetical protein AB1491_12495 [Thermodesulfobacteriota bacterium]